MLNSRFYLACLTGIFTVNNEYHIFEDPDEDSLSRSLCRRIDFTDCEYQFLGSADTFQEIVEIANKHNETRKICCQECIDS